MVAYQESGVSLCMVGHLFCGILVRHLPNSSVVSVTAVYSLTQIVTEVSRTVLSITVAQTASDPLQCTQTLFS